MTTYNLTAGGVYSIEIASVANTSKYPDGTLAPYTFTLTLDLLSGTTPLIQALRQTVSFGPGEVKSIVNGDPITFNVTMPTSPGSFQLIAKLLDVGGNILNSGSANVNLTSATGNLAVGSNPPGATVWINGISQGLIGTPLTIGGLAAGNYTLTLKLAGYQDWSQQITVTAGQSTNINANLVVTTGNVTINSTPPGAQIIIVAANDANGSPVQIGNPNPGITPLTFSLPANISYQILCRLNGYLDLTQTFTLLPGPLTLNFTLLSSIPNYTPLPVSASWGIVGANTDSTGVNLWIQNKIALFGSGQYSAGWIIYAWASAQLDPSAPVTVNGYGSGDYAWTEADLSVGGRLYPVNGSGTDGLAPPYFVYVAQNGPNSFNMPANGQTVQVSIPWTSLPNNLSPIVYLSIKDLMNLGYLKGGFPISFYLFGYYGPKPQQYGPLPSPVTITIAGPTQL